MRIFRFALPFLTAGLLVLGGCTSNEKKDVSTEQAVYELAQKYLNSNNWATAISTLQLLEENFPFGTYGEQAQLELIYAYFRQGSYDEAVVTADRFIRLHPQHRRADYAYYMRGLASFHNESSFLGALFGEDNTNKDPGAARDSFDQFAQFIQLFPNSPYAPDAQKRMLYLRNVLARQEIHVANYYFTRGAYLAAARRGNYVVENYPSTPAVPDALAVMAQAYYLMGHDSLGDDSVRVLALNYPEHPSLEGGSFDRRYIFGKRDRNWLSYLTFGIFDSIESKGFDTRELYNPEFFEDAPEP